MLEVQHVNRYLRRSEPDLKHASLDRGMVQQQILVQENVVEIFGAFTPHALEGPLTKNVRRTINIS